MLTVFVWSAIIVTSWLTAKTLSNFEVVIVACAVEAIVAATSLASFVLCITTTNSSHQGGANRIWVGKIFINGGILRGAESERVVGIEDSQRDAVHATSEGETLLLQVADGALFETCGSRDKNSFAGQINVIR